MAVLQQRRLPSRQGLLALYPSWKISPLRQWQTGAGFRRSNYQRRWRLVDVLYQHCVETFFVLALKALLTSTSSTASDSSSLNLFLIAWIVDSQPASSPAHVWRQPNEEMISSRRAAVMTFPAIRLRISPTPIGRSPGFLFSGISLDM